MAQTLPVSRLISIAVSLTAAGAKAQNLSTLLILGSSPVIDVVERYRNYATLDAVAADFGTTAPEYLAAQLWFGQSPAPTSLLIGRWAQAATSGLLRGASLSAAQQMLSNFTAVTTGAFKYARNGGAQTDVTGLNFSAATSLAQVASIITTALSGNATMVWNSVFGRFELTSSTTGAPSAISFLSAPSTGTDISALLGMTAASSGAYVANGIVAETALVAATLFDSNYGQSWYALQIIGAVNSDHLAVASYIEGANNKHIYGVTSQEAGVLSSVSTTDIAYQLAQLKYKRSIVIYSSTSPYAIASVLARLLIVDYTGTNTAITLMYKQLPGITAESLNVTQITALEAKNCNVSVNYSNGTAILETGVMSSGDFADTVAGTDWLAVTLMTSLYNLLYTTTTKIPQTDAGTHLMVAICEAVCSQGVVNGLLAPGQWNSTGFGPLSYGDFLAKGFMVYAPPVAAQNPTDRAARKSVAIQIAAKLAGAVHNLSVSVTVNQ